MLLFVSILGIHHVNFYCVILFKSRDTEKVIFIASKRFTYCNNEAKKLIINGLVIAVITAETIKAKEL